MGASAMYSSSYEGFVRFQPVMGSACGERNVVVVDGKLKVVISLRTVHVRR